MSGTVVGNADSPLPVHGYVLAGGRSSRMGVDKALLCIEEMPLLAIALGKLHTFCERVAIAGNREDLAKWAPVVPERRLQFGPVAGVEAGLQAAERDWTLFLPVDVPFVPAWLLRVWANDVLRQKSLRLSYLRSGDSTQPAFCMLHKDCLQKISSLADRDERRLTAAFSRTADEFGEKSLWIADAATLQPQADPVGKELAMWFTNVNTPEDLLTARQRAKHEELQIG